jgi:hypothetical protein
MANTMSRREALEVLELVMPLENEDKQVRTERDVCLRACTRAAAGTFRGHGASTAVECAVRAPSLTQATKPRACTGASGVPQAGDAVASGQEPPAQGAGGGQVQARDGRISSAHHRQLRLRAVRVCYPLLPVWCDEPAGRQGLSVDRRDELTATAHTNCQ